jgi:hypothetical protein
MKHPDLFPNRILWFLGPVALAIFVLFSTASCHRPSDNSTNLLKADTLQRLVNLIDETLILDEDHFKARMDSMNIKLKVMRAKYRDTTDGETQSAIVRYSGIEKNYEDFLKTYPVMQFDCDNHKKMIETFKQNIIAQKATQAEIEKFSDSERPLLIVLLDQARTFTRNTYSIEGDYNRTDPIMTKLYHKEKNM